MERSLSDILIKALDENDINHLIKDISLYLGYPVMLTDVDFNLLVCYPEGSQDDPLWDALLEYGVTPLEFINKMHIDGTMEYSANSSSPYILDWGFLEGFPRVLVNLTRNQKSYGHLTILCEDHSAKLSEEMKNIANVLSILLEQISMGGVMADDYQTMFMNYLLSAKNIEEEQLEQWESNLQKSLQNPYYLIYGLCNKKHLEKNVNHIKELIKRLYPDALAVIRNKELIVMFTDMDSKDSIRHIVKKIQDMLSPYSLAFGISNKFYMLDKPYIYLNQAKYAWSTALEKKVSYMEYRECILHNMIAAVYSSLPKNSYEHDAVSKIREYDKKNNTEYLKTLSAYVESLFHAKETIDILHIHRNTLPHRLEMIEKIGQLDLNDPETCAVLMMNHFMKLY